MAKAKSGIVAGSLLAIVLAACLLVGATRAEGASPSAQMQTRLFSLTLPAVPVSTQGLVQADQALLGAAPVLNDGFETSMALWTPDGSPNWGRTSYRAASGTYSAYCARSGIGGVNPPGPYPNNSDAFMSAGPFDLSDVGTAVLEFDLWLDSEDDWDWVAVMASPNGLAWDGAAWSGYSNGWDSTLSLDLGAVPTETVPVNMIGDASVWIGFWFVSDEDTRYEGAYLDNVHLVTTPPLPTEPPTITGISPNFGSTAGGKVVTITGTNLTGATAVTFGGTPATSVTVNGLTSITATTPAHATAETVNVQVTTPLGPSADTVADDFAYMPPVAYTSLKGTDRFDTAIRLSQAAFAGTLPAGSGVVLAPGWESYQEALCGAPLAAAWGGPVLLSSKTALYSGVAAELARLDPDQVFCIGLTGTAVADAVRALLPGATVTSINGTLNNVYHMSYLVAKKLGEKVGDMTSATGVVTIGYNFPDAIGVSALACYEKWPILLTDHSDGTAMNAYAVQAMNELGITSYVKAGTYVPDPAGITGLGNCSGADRYFTSSKVAIWAKAYAGLTYTHTALTTGDKFPDALAAGPYLAADHGMLLLSPLNGPLPVPIAALITANRAEVAQVSYIACVEPVISQVKALLP